MGSHCPSTALICSLGSVRRKSLADEEQPGSSTPAAEEEARTTLQAEQEAEPAAAAIPVTPELTTTAEEAVLESRARRSLPETDDYEPEFPWDRVLEFQQSIIWD